MGEVDDTEAGVDGLSLGWRRDYDVRATVGSEEVLKVARVGFGGNAADEKFECGGHVS